MKTWIKVLLILFVVGIAVAALVWIFYINKPKTNFEKKKADFTLSAKDLYNAYKAGKTKADSLYLDKVVEIDGTFTKVENADSQMVVVFVFEQGDFGDQGIRCNMLPKFSTELSKAKAGTEIKIKGHCVGYDDTDVKLSNCSVVK